MSDRNWEAEMAKIDRQLASVSDEALLAQSKGAAPTRTAGRPPAASTGAAPGRWSGPATPAGGAWWGWIKVGIAIGAAAGLMFWPWPARCGAPLIGFVAATGAVAVLGLWSAVGTWRHRLAVAHVASLLVVLWGLALGAREVLPRVGYAVPTSARGAGWSCPASGIPASATSAPDAAPTASPVAR